MKRSSRLEHSLHAFRYRQATPVVVDVLERLGISPGDWRVLAVSEVDEISSKYFRRLRESAAGATHWSPGQHLVLQGLLDRRADRLEKLRVIWLASPDPGAELVGVELNAGVLLRAATTDFVSRAADLMLCTQEAKDGICVELNPSWVEEYEVVSWGVFSFSPG